LEGGIENKNNFNKRKKQIKRMRVKLKKKQNNIKFD
jgi:hypothetical protein